MKNTFCILKSDLKALWMEKRRQRLLNRVTEFSSTLTLQEMLSQMENEMGAFAQASAAETKKFANKTENVEIFFAFDLADFYFPGEDAELCFKMRKGFQSTLTVSYDNIVANIEGDTPVDCLIKSGNRHFNFQMKRYPQEYLAHTREELSKYIIDTIRGYGNMKGTSLIILLQPNTEGPNDLNFKDVHEDIRAIQDEVSFDEIVLIFNERNQQIRWQQLFPQFGYAVKPLILFSEKYQAKQKESLRKII